MSNDVLIEITLSGSQLRLNVRAPNLPDAGIQLLRRPLILPPDAIEQLRSGNMSPTQVRDIASTVSQWLLGAELNLVLSELLGRQDDEPIQLIFSIDERLQDQFADIPLELLWAEGSGGPLALHPRIAAIVRLTTRSSGPLRVLIVRSNPLDLGGAVPPALLIRDEIFRLLRPELDPAIVHVDVLSREEDSSVAGLPTRKQLFDQLNRSYDILIYLGHGDTTSDSNYLQLEMPNGTGSDPISAAALAEALSHKPVPVVLLIGCLTVAEVPEAMRTEVQAALPRWMRGAQGVAQALVNSVAGVQLAIGMRYRLESEEALLFLVAWFRSLLRDQPGDVETAVSTARLALYLLRKSSYSWSSPVVFGTTTVEPLFGFLRRQSHLFIATITDVADVTTQVALPAQQIDQPVSADTPLQQPTTSNIKRRPRPRPPTISIRIPLHNRWLATLGVHYNPFAFPYAEQIPLALPEMLERTFFVHPGYDERFADRDRSAVLLAAQGGGKTASRRRLTDLLTLSYSESTRVVTDPEIDQIGRGVQENQAPGRIDRAVLRQEMVRHFDETDLRDLSFDLNIDYERLSGKNIADKARELITYCERRERLLELIQRIQSLRPSIPWMNVTRPASLEKSSSLIDVRPLVVTYTDFRDVVKRLPRVTLQHHAKPLCAAIAEAVYSLLTENPEPFLTQISLLRQWWWRFLQIYLPGVPLATRVRDQRLAQDVLRLGDDQRPFPARTSVQQMMVETFEHLERLGFNRMFLLIDGIDSEMETLGQSAMEMLVQPLLNTHSLLTLPGIVYKFFLPDVLAELVHNSSGYLNGRLELLTIRWDEASLRELLRLRLQWASDDQSNDIAQWCNQELLESVDVGTEIVRLALRHKEFGPPRALLHFGSLLVKVAGQQPSSPLSLSDWTSFLDEARQWCAPR